MPPRSTKHWSMLPSVPLRLGVAIDPAVAQLSVRLQHQAQQVAKEVKDEDERRKRLAALKQDMQAQQTCVAFQAFLRLCGSHRSALQGSFGGRCSPPPPTLAGHDADAAARHGGSTAPPPRAATGAGQRAL
jgi:hypothetical protein